MATQAITGNCPELIEAMEKAGILPPLCRRVVIDICYDEIVTIYYERFADEKLLDIDFTKHFINIKTAKNKEDI